MNKRYQEPPPGGERMAKKIIDGVITKVIESRTHTPNKIKVPENRNTVEDTSVWICPLCSVKIKQKQNIGRHKNLNCAGVKPMKIKPPKAQTPPLFKCNHCTATYTLKKSLTVHMKQLHLAQYCVENKKSLIQCPKCDFKTIAEKYLKQHESKFHLVMEAFSCDICDKKYKTKDSLRVHMKKIHLLGTPSQLVCEFCGSLVSSDSRCNSCHISVASNSEANNKLVINIEPNTFVMDSCASKIVTTIGTNTIQTNMLAASEGNTMLANSEPNNQESTCLSNKNVQSSSPSMNINNNSIFQVLNPVTPELLNTMVNFPCKLEPNTGGSSSLYRVAAEHSGHDQEAWCVPGISKANFASSKLKKV